MCTPSGSVTSCGEPSGRAVAAGGVEAIVSVDADAAGALGSLFLLQADMARAVSAASVISRPRVMNLSYCAGVCLLTVDPGCPSRATRATHASHRLGACEPWAGCIITARQVGWARRRARCGSTLR